DGDGWGGWDRAAGVDQAPREAGFLAGEARETRLGANDREGFFVDRGAVAKVGPRLSQGGRSAKPPARRAVAPAARPRRIRRRSRRPGDRNRRRGRWR